MSFFPLHYKESRSSKGAFRMRSEVWSGRRRLRMDSQSIPGRLWASVSPVLRPGREVLSLELGPRRAGNARPDQSQEAWPEAESAGKLAGESRSEAPEGERALQERASAPGTSEWRHSLVQRGLWTACAFRRSAPFFSLGRRFKILRGLVVVNKARARIASRERNRLFIPPRPRGEKTLRRVSIGIANE